MEDTSICGAILASARLHCEGEFPVLVSRLGFGRRLGRGGELFDRLRREGALLEGDALDRRRLDQQRIVAGLAVLPGRKARETAIDGHAFVVATGDIVALVVGNFPEPKAKGPVLGGGGGRGEWQRLDGDRRRIASLGIQSCVCERDWLRLESRGSDRAGLDLVAQAGFEHLIRGDDVVDHDRHDPSGGLE